MTGTTNTSNGGLDPIAFLQRLIRMETCDPPGREIEIATVVLEELRAHGIEAELY